jgi:hypothetical protein
MQSIESLSSPCSNQDRTRLILDDFVVGAVLSASSDAQFCSAIEGIGDRQADREHVCTLPYRVWNGPNFSPKPRTASLQFPRAQTALQRVVDHVGLPRLQRPFQTRSGVAKWISLFGGWRLRLRGQVVLQPVRCFVQTKRVPVLTDLADKYSIVRCGCQRE